MMYRVLIFSLYFLTGCYSHSDIMVIDSKFTEKETDLIEEAIDFWINATDSDRASIVIVGTFSSVTFTEDVIKRTYDTNRMFKVSKDDPGFSYLDKENPDFIGVHYKNGNIAILEEKTRDALIFKTVVAHEIGHLLGLNHSNGIMSYRTEKMTTCISKTVLREFCNKHTCGPDAKPMCLGPKYPLPQ